MRCALWKLSDASVSGVMFPSMPLRTSNIANEPVSHTQTYRCEYTVWTNGLRDRQTVRYVRHAGRQAGRQTETDRHADGGWTDRQMRVYSMDEWTERQTDRQTDSQICQTYRQASRQTDGWTDSQTDVSIQYGRMD